MAARDFAERIQACEEGDAEAERDRHARSARVDPRAEDRERPDEDQYEGAEEFCGVLLPGFHALTSEDECVKLRPACASSSSPRCIRGPALPISACSCRRSSGRSSSAATSSSEQSSTAGAAGGFGTSSS